MNTYANITPEIGLGGFLLGLHISEYSNLLERYNILGKLEYEQIDIYSTRYSFNEVPIEINIDNRTGIIYKISALEGYSGKLFNSIQVGSSAKDLINLKMKFYYDEGHEAFLSKLVSGVSIEVSDEDLLPDEALGLDIKHITVYQPKIFKPKRF